MGLNLATVLTESAKRHPDRVALKLGPYALTYADLDALSDRFAGHLAATGTQAGDRVGVMLPNVPQFAIAYYGALKAGAVVVPMNVLLKGREVAYYLRDSGAGTLVAWGGFLDEAVEGAREAQVGAVVAVAAPGQDLAELPELGAVLAEARPLGDVVQRSADDVAVLLYTSGTTGSPKGAELTHSNLLWNAHLAATTLVDISADDVVLGALPLFHSFGQTCGLNATIHAGGCLALVPRFEPRAALDVLEGERVTVFQGVPTMFGALLNDDGAAARDLTALRLCLSGGAALPVEVLRGFEERFGCQVLEGYGLSETSPVASFNHPDRASKPGSIGTPIWGVEMKVVDDAGDELPTGEVGEIVIRGHNVMRGYHDRPDATAEAVSPEGWFRTGDMARVDEDGFFFIVDRKKDLIIRGGYNVYPREIEEVLYEHPAVVEAAVVGIPHTDLGEEVAALVVTRADADIDPDALRAWVKDRVAAYKYPRTIAFVAELPKGPTGKILKREIDTATLTGERAEA